MRIFSFIACAALAACTGAEPLASGPSTVGAAQYRPSWITPNTGRKSLLYVSDYNSVDVYEYGTSKQVGSLDDFSHAAGSCSDKAGNVYVTNTGSADVLKFVHGGTKPAYLIDPSPYPVDCAIDAARGDLAVINEYGVNEYSPGNVAVYAGGKGKPQVYKTPFTVPLTSAAYDAAGDLLLSAYQNRTFAFGLLAKSQQKFESITLQVPQDWNGPPDVRWDGEYFVVGFGTEDVDQPNIFAMYTIKGNTAVRQGYSLAERAGESGPFWLGKIGGPKSLKRANRLILCGTYDYGGVSYYYYPEGGAAVFKTQSERACSGVTVSAPS